MFNLYRYVFLNNSFIGQAEMEIMGFARCNSNRSLSILFAIANLQNLPVWLPWLFIGLCLVLWIFRYISWILTTGLSQEIIYDLRLKMTQRIFNCPLQKLDNLGSSKLLATLTGDINSISGASIQLSLIMVNLAVLVGIFAYLCWLSPLLFLIVFVSLAVPIAVRFYSMVLLLPITIANGIVNSFQQYSMTFIYSIA